jgi:hypothetical protein
MPCAMRALEIFAHNQWGLLGPHRGLDLVSVRRVFLLFEEELALTE